MIFKKVKRVFTTVTSWFQKQLEDDILEVTKNEMFSKAQEESMIQAYAMILDMDFFIHSAWSSGHCMCLKNRTSGFESLQVGMFRGKT
jgi:hypothetical protein